MWTKSIEIISLDSFRVDQLDVWWLLPFTHPLLVFLGLTIDEQFRILMDKYTREAIWGGSTKHQCCKGHLEWMKF